MSHEVGSTGPSTPSSGSTGGSVASSAAAKLFDLRVLIGGLFTL